jgi:hypothetical protein
MTTDAVASDLIDPPPLYCYRHPDRETWVRCGRCDQPICTSCAMQGPVGLRCKTCGKPSRDALVSLKPNQIVTGFVVALGLGAVAGWIGTQLGFLMIVVGFFAGTLIAEVIDRSIGIKRGPRIVAVAVAGIVLGGVIGATLSLGGLWGDIQMFAAVAQEAGEPVYTLEAFLFDNVPQALIGIGATVVGAGVRLR